MMKEKKWLNKKHLSLIIVLFLLVSFSSLICYYVPVVKGDLGSPRSIIGSIKHASNGSAIPDGVTVTLIDVDSGTMDNATTQGGAGFYIFTVQFGVDVGDIMAINCSWWNSTDASWEHGAGACNLTGAGGADEVNFTLETEDLSISLNDSSWDAGTLALGDNSSTADTYFNLTNEGNTKINVSIYGENITFNGDQWDLKATTGDNEFNLSFMKKDDSWTAILVTNVSFRTNLYPNNGSSWWFYKISPYTYWQAFGLRIELPPTADNTPSATEFVNVTFWSIKA